MTMNLNLNAQIKLYLALAAAAVLLLCIAAGAYLLGYDGGFDNGFRLGYQEETAAREIPPASLDSLDLAVNIEKVLQGITEYQSQAPTPAFKGAVDEIHKAMLSAVATAYRLSDEELQNVLAEYEAMSDSVAAFYFEELQAMHQQRESHGAASDVRLTYYETSGDFAALLTDRICWVTGTAMTFASLDPGYKAILKNTCGFLIGDLVNPVVDEMKTQGLVYDIERAEYTMREHTRSAIAELATAEDRVTTTVNRTFTRRILNLFNSTAELRIEAAGTVKAGFALHEDFSVTIDHDSRIISIVLPPAKVLSKDVSYHILEDEDGVFVEITKERRNRVHNELRQTVEEMALQRGLLEAAEARARTLVTYIYSPLTNLPGPSYQVQVFIKGETALQTPTG